jgi:hypothetical protein
MRIAILLVPLLAASGGCQWLKPRPRLEPTPIQFQQSPTLEQLMAAVNGNTQRVQTLQTRDGRLLLRGLPAVSLDLTFEQPRRLRLRAGTSFTGQELDLGSNDELFWFWAKQSPQPGLFYARHDQFALSPNRGLLPIEPTWVIDAMGLPRFEANQQHEGPIARPGGLVEIRSRTVSAEGETTKITLLNPQYAWVLQQQVFNARGQLIASAKASDHEFFPHSNVALPRTVAIELPPAQMNFTVETKGYSLNLPLNDPASLFALPREQFPNVPLVDLADPRLAPPTTAAPSPHYPTTSYTPRIRGMQ